MCRTHLRVFIYVWSALTEQNMVGFIDAVGTGLSLSHPLASQEAASQLRGSTTSHHAAQLENAASQWLRHSCLLIMVLPSAYAYCQYVHLGSHSWSHQCKGNQVVSSTFHRGLTIQSKLALAIGEVSLPWLWTLLWDDTSVELCNLAVSCLCLSTFTCLEAALHCACCDFSESDCCAKGGTHAFTQNISDSFTCWPSSLGPLLNLQAV